MVSLQRVGYIVLLFNAGIIMSSGISSTTGSTSAAFAAASPQDGGKNSNSRGTSSEERENNEVLRLPPADPNDQMLPRIKLGETIRFEEWGPIILNTDGTTRRIENWDQLTEKEKEVTWRRISKRNEERRKMLLEQFEQEGKQGKTGEL